MAFTPAGIAPPRIPYLAVHPNYYEVQVGLGGVMGHGILHEDPRELGAGQNHADVGCSNGAHINCRPTCPKNRRSLSRTCFHSRSERDDSLLYHTRLDGQICLSITYMWKSGSSRKTRE